MFSGAGTDVAKSSSLVCLQVWVAPCVPTESFPLDPSEFLVTLSLLRQRGQALEVYIHHSSQLGEEARPYFSPPVAILLPLFGLMFIEIYRTPGDIVGLPYFDLCFRGL